MLAKRLSNYRLAAETALIVAALMAVRALLYSMGIHGLSVTPLVSAIMAGGIFVVGIVLAGRLSDYEEAERAPSQLAGSLYAILRESEAIHAVWGRPQLPALRKRLVAVVSSLRSDINLGNTRSCLKAVEGLSQSLIELDDSDVPSSYIALLRQEQAAMRTALLRVYHIQREEFLPSAYAMIVSLVAVILALLMFTDVGSMAESLVTLGILSFFFLHLLRLIGVVNRPFKVGHERTDDDVSLFLLHEFVVQAQAEGEVVAGSEVVEQAEGVEHRLIQEEVASSADDKLDPTAR